MIKNILILSILVLLSGCSIKMAYNNLDRMIRWGVSDYVDLNDAQQDVLERELDKLHMWHRQNHLPQYAELTRTLAQQSVDEISPARMREVSEQFQFWATEVEEQFTPLIVAIMISLTEEQMVALPAKMKKSNTEWAEAEADKTLRESQQEWAEGLTGMMKNFTGKLNKDQRAYIDRRSLEYRPERVLWAAYRARFQDALFALLKNRHDETFPQAYRQLIEERETYWGDELREIFTHNEQLNMDVSAYVLSNLTAKQSERFVETLTELSEDLDDLSRQT